MTNSIESVNQKEENKLKKKKIHHILEFNAALKYLQFIPVYFMCQNSLWFTHHINIKKFIHFHENDFKKEISTGQ